MKLLLDFGNSRCKWALFHQDQLSHNNAAAYSGDNAEMQLAALLLKLPLSEITSIHVVSVLGEKFNAQIAKALAAYDHYFYQSEASAHGIKLAYAEAGAYGNDRYLALLAAHHNYKGNKLIIDCGTAITIDGITAAGEHVGGLIMPSYASMVLALNKDTQSLPAVEIDEEVQLFCATTSSAMTSGSLLCLQQGLSAVIQQMKLHLDDDCVLIATGGNRVQMLSALSGSYSDAPNLVLEGLAYLVEERSELA